MGDTTTEIAKLICERNKAGFLRGGKSLVTRGARHGQIARDVSVTWKHSLVPDETDDTPVYEINANIRHSRFPKRIGYYQAYMLFPTEQCLDSRALFELCDSLDQTLCEFSEQLYGADTRLQQLLDGGELLFVHLIELLPLWHGHGIGSAVFRFMLQEARRAFGASVCIFEPVPLQFESPSKEKQLTPKHCKPTRSHSALSDGITYGPSLFPLVIPGSEARISESLPFEARLQAWLRT